MTLKLIAPIAAATVVNPPKPKNPAKPAVVPKIADAATITIAAMAIMIKPIPITIKAMCNILGANTRASACQSSTHVPSAIVPLKFIIAKPNSAPAAANKANPAANTATPIPNTLVSVPATTKIIAAIVTNTIAIIASIPTINIAIAFMFSPPQVKVFSVPPLIKLPKSNIESLPNITNST